MPSNFELTKKEESIERKRNKFLEDGLKSLSSLSPILARYQRDNS